MKLNDRARFNTVCIHAGQEPDPSTGAIITPIYQTSTYVQEGLGQHKGFEYGRTQNPTRMALEANLAAIERGTAAFAFASGMAAIDAHPDPARIAATISSSATTPTAARSGCSSACGASSGSISPTWTRRGSTPIEPGDHAEDQVPVHRNADQPDAAHHRSRRGERASRTAATSGSSSTTRSPARTFSSRWRSAATSSRTARPSSSTATATASAASSCSSIEDDVEWMKFVQNAAGAILGPMDSWLVLRGTKTLPDPDGADQRQRAGPRRTPRRRIREVKSVHLSRPAPTIRITRWPSSRCAASAG